MAFDLCLIFNRAPPSYRQFSLCWTDECLLSVELAGDAWTEESGDDKVQQMASDALAEHMRDCSVHLNMSVTVVKEANTSRIVVVRL